VSVDERFQAMRDEAARGRLTSQTENAFWRAVSDALLVAICQHGYVKAEADDLVQASLIVVHLKLAKFEPEGPRGFSAWLKEIARLEALDHRARPLRYQRKLERLRRLAVRESGTTPRSWTLDRERLNIVAMLASELTTPQRDALEFPDHFALANARGITIDAAKKRWDRAVAGLRKAWARFRNTSPLRKVTPS
jgi:DNA-directed RNA polymerase specialized sigma24 family protein